VDARFLIAGPAGNNGAQASGPIVAEASKSDGQSGGTAFGRVLTQVGEQSAVTVDSSEPVPVETSETTTAAILSPLQMALALQASALAAVPTNPNDVPVVPDGQWTQTESADPLLVTTTDLLAPTSGRTGSATAARADAESPFEMSWADIGPGTGPTESGPPQTAADMTALSGAPSVDRAQPQQTLSIADLAENIRQDLPAQAQSDHASDPVAAQAPHLSVADAAAHDRADSQADLARRTQLMEASATAADRTDAAEASRLLKDAQPAAATASLHARGLTQVNAAGAGQPLQTPSELTMNEAAGPALPQQAALQGQAAAEQARALTASTEFGKGKGQGKATQETETTQSVSGAERVVPGHINLQTGRIDAAIKPSAAAPVAPVAPLPTEPPAAPLVQSLRLEVRRPDLGDVQVRVVLADQTVHTKVTTGQVEVRDFLVARQGQLDAGFKASGLDMGEFNVTVDAQGHSAYGQLGQGWSSGPGRDGSAQGRGTQEPPNSFEQRPDPRETSDGRPRASWEPRVLSLFA